jgi:hypothetical protein
MNNEIYEEPVSPQVQELINVFKNDLSAVSFPDVNLEILETLVQKVTSGAKELNDIMSHVDEVRQSLEDSRNELQTKSIRGLAYAKVFAEGNSNLLEKLSGINLGKTSRSSKKTVEKPENGKNPETPAGEPKSEERKHAKPAKKVAETEQSDV